MKKLAVSLMVICLFIHTGCKISGTVSDNGAGIENVRMILDGFIVLTPQAATGSDGKYTFDPVFPYGVYSIHPEKDGYAFYPESKLMSTTVNFGMEGVNFEGTDCNEETCRHGDYLINSVEELNNFSQAGYTVMIGSLVLSNTDFTGLEALESLTKVCGDLTIQGNSSLTDLDGFGNLLLVGGNLIISSNPSLTSLGFTQLTAVRGNFIIRDNVSLPRTDAEALRNSITIGGIFKTICGNLYDDPCYD